MSRSRPPVLAHLEYQKHSTNLRALGLQEKFEYIHRENMWGSPESVSGLGSTLAVTTPLRRQLSELCKRFQVHTMIDAPCGDFVWMSAAALPVESYLGIDIVEFLIEQNRKLYGRESITFQAGDLTSIELPERDLILCRDCLVHLSFDNIRRVLSNFINSDSKYLLTTTFPENDLNIDIENGDWRMLNFQIKPFDFPDPILLIDEECNEVNGAYNDKSLGLWELRALRDLEFVHALEGHE
jgi:methyltransferase family protein